MQVMLSQLLYFPLLEINTALMSNQSVHSQIIEFSSQASELESRFFLASVCHFSFKKKKGKKAAIFFLRKKRNTCPLCSFLLFCPLEYLNILVLCECSIYCQDRVNCIYATISILSSVGFFFVIFFISHHLCLSEEV